MKSLEEHIQRYLSHCRKIRDEKTVSFKEHALSWLEELLPLSVGDVYELYERMRGRTSHATAVAYLEEIGRFYEFLQEQGYDYSFPRKALREIRRRKEQKGQRRKYFTEEEISAILSNLRGINGRPKHPIYYLLSIFLLSSGLRISEALQVRRKDIYGREWIRKDGGKGHTLFVKVKGKFSKEREALLYFFYKEHEHIIKRRLEELSEEDPFFTYTIRYPKSEKTLVLSKDAVMKTFSQVEKEVGFPVNAHRFRYTYATWLATKGFPPNLLKDILGHSSIKTTLDIYAQAQREKIFEVLETL